jgi:hypothetical protein
MVDIAYALSASHSAPRTERTSAALLHKPEAENVLMAERYPNQDIIVDISLA